MNVFGKKHHVDGEFEIDKVLSVLWLCVTCGKLYHHDYSLNKYDWLKGSEVILQLRKHVRNSMTDIILLYSTELET